MASQSSVARRARGDDQAVFQAAARLTGRDRYLVRVVAEHRVLTTDQLAALAFDSTITARHRLDALARLGALNRFRPHRATGSAPWHYLLGPLGAALLGAEDRDDKRWRTWLTESHTAELFYQYPISLSALASLPQPDGAGVWADGCREIAFMLEYDTGSEH
jgi:Replication-relaxation